MSYYKRKSFGSNTYQNNSLNSFNKSYNKINNIKKNYNNQNKNLSSYYSSYSNKNISLNYPLPQKTIQPITIDINSSYFNQKYNKSLTNNRGEYTYRSNTNNSSLYERNNDKNFKTLNNRQNHSLFERVETSSKYLRNKTKSISYVQLPTNDSYNDNNNVTTADNII